MIFFSFNHQYVDFVFAIMKMSQYGYETNSLKHNITRTCNNADYISSFILIK